MMPLFETICWQNGTTPLLDYHQQRLNRSFYTLFKKSSAPKIEKILQNSEKFHQLPSKGLFRLRLSYGEKDHLLEIFPYQQKTIQTFKPVVCNEINYHLKWNNRQLLASLLQQKQECDEIIIIKNGFITDCSIGNLIFRQKNQWFTPTTPLLHGTQRAFLLDSKKIFEQEISLENWQDFEEIRLINAMNNGGL